MTRKKRFFLKRIKDAFFPYPGEMRNIQEEKASGKGKSRSLPEAKAQKLDPKDLPAIHAVGDMLEARSRILQKKRRLYAKSERRFLYETATLLGSLSPASYEALWGFPKKNESE